MRKVILPAMALVALLGAVSAASADSEEAGSARLYLFGDCEATAAAGEPSTQAAGHHGIGCRGFGIFVGGWDAESMGHRIVSKAAEAFGHSWYVSKLLAFNLAQRGQAVTGTEYDQCLVQPAEDEGTAVAQPQAANGLFIAWFSLEPCATN